MTSTAYLDEARLCLQAQELRAAIALGWQAAQTTLQAAAKARSLPCQHHHEEWLAIRALIEEGADRDLNLNFAAVQTMHINIFDVEYEAADVAWFLEQVEQLLGKLDALSEPAMDSMGRLS